MGSVFGSWVSTWVSGGCGFFFFFWLWPVLKGVVGRGWVRCLGRWSWLGLVFGSWLGCWSWIGEASHGLSLISHRGSASWVWIGGLGSVDGGFETVDLLIGGWIGWVDHRWLRWWLRWWFFLNGFALVGFRSAGFQISGMGFWSVAWVCWSVAWVVGVVAVVGSNWFDGLCVCGSVDGLMVCVCVCGFVDGLMVCVCVCVCVVMGLDRLIVISWVCVLNQC